MHEQKEQTGLRVRGLGLSIDGEELLSDIDFSLCNTGITVLMGPNGAGKSLLMRVLHGLISATVGEVTWNGAAVSQEVTRRQSLVFQSPVLLRRSVSANVDFVLRARGVRAPKKRDAALDQVGLLHLAKHSARTLSGGEKQRLALARALVTRPDALLLDEPTANLDPSAVQIIERIVEKTARGGAKVIFVTHDLGQARRLADDVLFLHLGKLLEHSPANEFFTVPKSAAAKAYLQGDIPL
ncbi:MAG: ATP-binding cassette domain-containing protein [Pseudomonadota bacterium]